MSRWSTNYVLYWNKCIHLPFSPQSNTLLHTCPHEGISSKHDVLTTPSSNSLVFPQLQVRITSGAVAQGGQLPEWHGFGHVWLPQSKGLSQVFWHEYPSSLDSADPQIITLEVSPQWQPGKRHVKIAISDFPIPWSKDVKTFNNN